MSDTNEKQVNPLTMGDILSGNCDENPEEVREVKRLMKETAQKISETFPAAIKAMTESFREFFRVENMKSLQAKLLLMKFRLDPSCVDSRRGKKRDCLSEYHVMLRAHALDAFHFNQSGHIKYFIDMATTGRKSHQRSNGNFPKTPLRHKNRKRVSHPSQAVPVRGRSGRTRDDIAVSRLLIRNKESITDPLHGRDVATLVQFT